MHLLKCAGNTCLADAARGRTGRLCPARSGSTALAGRCLGLLTALCLTSSASAHGLRTGYLEVLEREPGHALVVYRITVPDGSTSPTVDADCTLRPEQADPPATGSVRTWHLACAGSLVGHRLSITGLGPVIGEVTLRAVLADGRQQSQL